MGSSKEYFRTYYRNNRERILERDKAANEAMTPEEKAERAEYMKQYRMRNLEKWRRSPEQEEVRNANRRDRYANDAELREKTRVKVKEWQSNNPHKRKAQRIRQYDLSLEEFNSMLDLQDHKCAICGYSDRSVPKMFPVIDHCHTTGVIRGLLCANCNHALGKFKDNPETLRRAIEYLEVTHGEVADLVSS